MASVYQKIKARLVSGDFEQGKPIRICPLAEQLGVSTTPVREALGMLAVEGLATMEPKKGFSAVSLSEDRVIELNGWNRFLLIGAISAADPTAELSATVAIIGNKLDREKRQHPESLAKRTGELFASFAESARNRYVVQSVNHINDRLYRLRILECQQLTSVPVELMLMCELFLAEKFNELAREISRYHETRIKLAPGLIDSLTKHSQTRSQ